MRLGTAPGLRFDIPALSKKHSSARDARLPRLRDIDGSCMPDGIGVAVWATGTGAWLPGGT